jgi:hypothetical protein
MNEVDGGARNPEPEVGRSPEVVAPATQISPLVGSSATARPCSSPLPPRSADQSESNPASATLATWRQASRAATHPPNNTRPLIVSIVVAADGSGAGNG